MKDGEPSEGDAQCYVGKEVKIVRYVVVEVDERV